MDELEKKYVELFGSDAPIPPRHIMKTLVKMKQDGTFDTKMKAVADNYEMIKNKIETETGEKLTKDNTVFEIDFDKEKDKDK